MTASRTLFIEPLTQQAYAPFGQVIETEGAHHYPINGGMTERYHDLARVELGGVHPRPLISIARGQPYALPLTLRMVERHPLGSQAFYPLAQRPFLSIVAPDEGGIPGRPRAFLAAPGQGINMAMNTWHAVLTPLGETSDFLIIDRGGEGNNLEEYFFDEPYLVVEPD
ncbi:MULTISPECIES: ureidoglycolate lyase [unclassified Devosia]|jgi:ureidoglycolate lyase|uniref:ureidoglycolate lyase n=1 Tax=unclassified Devosia TaxID=196773 RepID=UPI00086DCF8C|nr:MULTISPECIES: ureidoglycolate lyase [unclassified Devosia]MBN9364121.1 ureidoglycolate lyase [Devosia sp.]ODS82049.1 MAG: Ureidoglycolate hydrolase [Devosia sp. SCN 66-27]OJX27366.1 MAG: Ureidoglycolate hydrolase [Devosia sp. 66-14]